MRIKISKILITAFIILLCSIMFIGGKFYISTVQSFKRFSNCGVALMSNVENSSYNELKQSIIDKYTKTFVNLLNATSKSFKEEISSVLGNDYLLLSEEFVTINDSISAKKRAYYLSEDFEVARINLETIKLKIDASTEEEKDKYLDEFRTALNEVSTLNTKLNNTLKGERERLDYIKGQVLTMFKQKSKLLLEVRGKYFDSMRIELSNLISNFNAELNELKLAFDIETSKTEYPFDIASMQDFSLAGKLETDCFNEILDSSSAVFIENSVKIQS